MKLVALDVKKRSQIVKVWRVRERTSSYYEKKGKH